MEPSVARTTKTHSVGLNGTHGSTWGMRALDLSWTSATSSTSEGKKLMNYLQNMSGGNYKPGRLYESVHASNNKSKNIYLNAYY